jgi:N-acetylglucosamine transport system substrate-binding protein
VAAHRVDNGVAPRDHRKRWYLIEVPTNPISLPDLVVFGRAGPEVLHNEQFERDHRLTRTEETEKMSDSPKMGSATGPAPAVSRRRMLQSAAAAGLLAVPAVGLLGACGTDSGGGSTGGGTKSDANPLAVKEDQELNVVIFNGGYTDKYAVDIHEPLYRKAFPKANIKHEGIVDIAKTQQTRFAAGTPADMVNNSGSGAMDTGALVADGQLADLTPLYDAPSVDDKTKEVRDTLVPGTIEVGTFNGKPFVLNYASTIYGIWYNGKLFQDKGWTAPTTWDDFKTLLGEIKKAGLIGYGFAGANAAYYHWNVILTHAAKIAGEDVLKNIDNLEDNAWKADAVKQAAEAWAEVGAKWSDKSFEGLKHTDVQLQQNQGKVVFYPSGSWLENEQKKATPPGFTYQMMPIPASGQLSAAGVRATAGEGFFVPEKAKNKLGGFEYLRRMLSKEGAQAFSKLVLSPTVVVGASDGVDFPPGTKSAASALSKAGKDVVDIRFDGWYNALDQEARTATNELMFGRIKVDAFCDRIQKKADELKKDSSVVKFKR